MRATALLKLFEDDGIRAAFNRLFEIGLELLLRRTGGFGVLCFGVIHIQVSYR